MGCHHWTLTDSLEDSEFVLPVALGSQKIAILLDLELEFTFIFSTAFWLVVLTKLAPLQFTTLFVPLGLPISAPLLQTHSLRLPVLNGPSPMPFALFNGIPMIQGCL